MRCNCSHGWKRTTKLKNLVVENSSVEIHDGVCNSADLCGITHCDYYDLTQEGTRRYLKALGRSHTLEGILEERRRKNPN
jgi:hypothetical protein